MDIKRAEKLTKIIEWAKSNDNVRVMLQTSSLTNPNAPTDILSDLDIELAVRDIEGFLSDSIWPSCFGEIITSIQESPNTFNDQYAMYMVFYEDYIKVDFRIYSLEKFIEQTKRNDLFEDWDIGYKVCIDKENITTNLAPPTYTAFYIMKPTEEEFRNVFNDFWWDITYVAKSLWRDELFYAKFISESVLRFEKLQKMLEWYIGMNHDWKITTNKYGRFFKRYLSPELWKKVESTFSGSDIEDNWDALFSYTDLCRELGIGLALKLGYSYPLEVDQKISTYLKKLRQLPKNNV